MTVEQRYLASICLIARHMKKATRTHPVRCAYCTKSIEELENICSAPVVAAEMSEWNRLSKFEKADRLDAARLAAVEPMFDLDL